MESECISKKKLELIHIHRHVTEDEQSVEKERKTCRDPKLEALLYICNKLTPWIYLFFSSFLTTSHEIKS